MVEYVDLGQVVGSRCVDPCGELGHWSGGKVVEIAIVTCFRVGQSSDKLGGYGVLVAVDGCYGGRVDVDGGAKDPGGNVESVAVSSDLK